MLNDSEIIPEEKYVTASSIGSVDINFVSTHFVTGGEKVEVWDIKKSKPIN